MPDLRSKDRDPEPAGPRPAPATEASAQLRRHGSYEAILTLLLLFGVLSAIRWFIGPSAVSRSIGNIGGEVALVGAAVTVIVWILILSPLGRRSGGHMNPAVTLAMWRYGKFPLQGVPYYVAAQLVGSVLGVLAGRIAWGGVVTHPPVAFAVLQPAHGWTVWELFLAETATMTTIILIVGLLLASPRLAATVPIAVGLLVGGTIACLGTITGGSANPARQFGPALLSGQTRFLWVYLLAPMLAALIAPVLRDQLQKRELLTDALCGPGAAISDESTRPTGAATSAAASTSTSSSRRLDA